MQNTTRAGARLSELWQTFALSEYFLAAATIN